MSDIESYLSDGMDLDNYDIIGIHPQSSGGAVIIMRYIREDSLRPWRLHFRGTDRYYETFEEALQYFKSRGWRFVGQKL